MIDNAKDPPREPNIVKLHFVDENCINPALFCYLIASTISPNCLGKFPSFREESKVVRNNGTFRERSGIRLYTLHSKDVREMRMVGR